MQGNYIQPQFQPIQAAISPNVSAALPHLPDTPLIEEIKLVGRIVKRSKCRQRFRPVLPQPLLRPEIWQAGFGAHPGAGEHRHRLGRLPIESDLIQYSLVLLHLPDDPCFHVTFYFVKGSALKKVL